MLIHSAADGFACRVACAERSMATPSRKGYTSLARNQADNNNNDSRFYDEQLRSDGWCAAVGARRILALAACARDALHTRARMRARPYRSACLLCVDALRAGTWTRSRTTTSSIFTCRPAGRKSKTSALA